MGHRHRSEDKQHHASRRRLQRAHGRNLAGAETGSITRDDLSEFSSIKPYLSESGQAVVDLLTEVRAGGRLDPSSLARLVGLVGGSNPNLAAVATMLGAMAKGSKVDPTTLVSLLGSLGQSSLDRNGQGEQAD